MNVVIANIFERQDMVSHLVLSPIFKMNVRIAYLSTSKNKKLFIFEMNVMINDVSTIRI